VPLIFSENPGVVGVFEGTPVVPMTVSIGGDNNVPAFGTGRQMKAVITECDLVAESGMEVKHTLRDRIYVYLFGERAQDVAIGGLAFADICGGQLLGYTGMEATMAYYETVRAGTILRPIRIHFGRQRVVRGFMWRYNYKLMDSGSGVGAFSFMFKAMPSLIAPSGFAFNPTTTTTELRTGRIGQVFDPSQLQQPPA
jgi:hypothetical protein